MSGKLRRYHHLSVWQHLLLPKVVLFNIRDVFLILIGFLQSVFKLVLWRPDVIFAKGGYVCLPVGFAARMLSIPVVLHDSDAHPGLTNRVLSKWASRIATGAPLEYYSYPKNISEYVGIPISPDFHIFSRSEKLEAKRQWGIEESSKVIVITGGGLGAKRVNNAVIEVLPDLLKLGTVVLISGADQYEELKSLTPINDSRFQLHAFVSTGMAQLLGASDIVLTRAGATTILELAALAKPTILVPNGRLTGGHQLKNAQVYAQANAVGLIDESEMIDDPAVIVSEIRRLLNNEQEMSKLSKNINKFARPDAAKRMAELVIEGAKKK